MGMRVRLKASFDISPYPPRAQVVLRALKRYGMIVADNGSDWYISGVADSRWNDADMNTLKNVKGSNFEVVLMTNIVK
jgi:histidinol phosphatase-like enzyme